ncbi:hybrid sensor histidine kinase/response regulator [Leptolyngbya sp. AN03gr2]
MTQSQRTVLIVDDFSQDRETYRRYLSSDPNVAYTILEAESAEDGLTLCQLQQLDGILLDFLLPDLDGVQFLTRLKAIAGDRCPAIVMMSGQGDASVAVQAIKSGAEDYLMKGRITADELRSTLKSAIENAELRLALKQTEQALRESEERYRAIVHDQTELICRFLPDGTLTFINHAYSHYFGTSPERLVGQNLVQLVPEADRDNVRQQITLLNALTPDNPILTQEHSVLKPSGEIGWQQWTNRVLFDAAGRIVEFQSVGRDISDRVRVEAEREAAEIASRESEARLRLALEAACMGTWEWNILTGEIIWSANMEPLFGLEPGSFDGRFETFANCLHPNDRDRVLNAITDAISLGEPFELEFRVVLPDGQVRWAASRGQACYDDAGRPIRMAGIDLDITQRKRTEETLHEREALFRGVFESDLIGILFWNTQGQITDANEAFCGLTGYSREELQAGEIYYQTITPPEYHEEDAQKFETLRTTGECSPTKKEYICKDGSRIPIMLGCAFLPGSDDHGVAFVLDIREQKSLEQERIDLLAEAQEARQSAEQANRTKDEFLAIVSHELRSPLNSILGWAKLLRTRKFDAAKVEQALETIERNAQAQSSLIEDLLDMSRILRGQLNLEAAPVHLAPIINVVVANTQLAATAKQIQLRSQIDPEVGRILGDVNRLQQIITNLMTNAVKFTPNGGQVDVSLERIGTQAAVRVKDTGQGISTEFLPYVFERFQQAENSTTRAKDGLGLGLAIVRHLVELHGGTVAVESPGIGQGATFTVMFPLIDECVQPETVKPTETIANLSQVKCLIVDDVPDTCEYLQFVLSEYGAIVAVANSAAQAYQLFQKFSPDILLSDIGMPEEDGYSLLQRIRQLPAGKKVSAIALTAFAKPEDRDRALAAGFQEHLPKPVAPENLMGVIATIVNSSRKL